MSAAAIQVEGLGKRYRIAAHGDPALRLRRAGLRLLRGGPFRRAPHGRDVEAEWFWALRDASFEVRPGEVVGVIGRNGAGKSTLLKILSRITPPSAGRAIVRGRVRSLLEVGTGFHPELSGRENVYLSGALLGMRRREIDAKFDAIVAFAEVERFLDTPVKRYSSGMSVRLGFAVAAHLEPEVLLVDEVLAVGDARFQARCLGKLEDAARGGRTVLFVSHNLPMIEALCHRALLIDGGRLVDAGPPAAIVRRYLETCVARTQEVLRGGGGRHIRAVRVCGADGSPQTRFAIGETIVFDLELHHPTPVHAPRCSIGIHSPRGERLLTIHTDVQRNGGWTLCGSQRLRAVWRNHRMVPDRYRVDVALWDYAREIESLPGCATIEVVAGDFYGTGTLPDPRTQGSFLPEAHWEVRGAESGRGADPASHGCGAGASAAPAEGRSPDAR